jgi:hypothetical protein
MKAHNKKAIDKQESSSTHKLVATEVGACEAATR